MSDINEMNAGPRWYVAHTYSGYENKVKMNLEKIVENRGLGHLILPNSLLSPLSFLPSLAKKPGLSDFCVFTFVLSAILSLLT